MAEIIFFMGCFFLVAFIGNVLWFLYRGSTEWSFTLAWIAIALFVAAGIML